MSATAAPLLELDDVDTYYGQIHILEDVNLEVARGRARLPARRQRLREVDDAEDDPRDRRSRATGACASPARTSRAADELPDRARASRSCPRTGACSRR